MITPLNEQYSRRPKPCINRRMFFFNKIFRTIHTLQHRWHAEYGYWPSKRRLRRQLAKVKARVSL